MLVKVTGALAGCCNKANAQEKSARPRVIDVITQRSEYLQRPRWFMDNGLEQSFVKPVN